MKKVILYSKDPCPFCVAAKRFLEGRGIPVEEIDLTGQEDEIERIKNLYGWRTVPIILIDGKLIGGFQDLKALEASGDLEKLFS